MLSLSTRPPEASSKALVLRLDVGEESHYALLFAVGDSIRCQVDAISACPDDLGLKPDKPGLWVWEGIFVGVCGWSAEYPSEGDSYPKGVWRGLTPEEWERVQQGKPPWEAETREE